MAEKRMFSKKIIDTDWFMDMPQSSQNLYFHLSMRADDDGFVSSPQRIIKMVGANNDDYKLLIGKKFIIPFESGVCVIKDWRINNYLRSDRYTETQYLLEKSQLDILENGEYSLNGNPLVYQAVYPDKIRLDLELDKNKKEINKEKIILQTKGGKMSTQYKKETFDTIIFESEKEEEVKDCLLDFVKMRQTIKRPLTNRALKTLINKLNNFSSNKNDKIKILEQSILNCWQDIYALKNDKGVNNGRNKQDDGQSYDGDLFKTN